MSIIKNHLVTKIKSEIKRKQDSVNFSGFFYFDNLVSDKKQKLEINRVNRESGFAHEKTYHISLHSISGSALVDIYSKLKQNDFYFYKKINGKDHKIRLKKDDRYKK
jgi:hypothetical protein